jgi:hypothetical protein
MGVKLSSATISSGGRDRIKLEDLFDVVQFSGQEPKTLRPIGDIQAVGTHWVGIVTKEGKNTNIGITCRNVKLDGTEDPNGGCAFCKIGHKSKVSYYENFIDTEEEENQPRNLGKPTPEEKKAGFKLKGTKLWTPVRVMVFPGGVAQTMQGITKKNKDKEQRVRELSDPAFGRALDVAKDTRKGTAPANMWSVQKSDNMMRKLTADQREYWLWDLNLLKKLYPTAKESETEMKKLVVIMQDEEFEKVDLSEYPELLAKRKKDGKKKSKSGAFAMDDDDEDDMPKKKRRVIDDDDDDDDDMPSRSKRRNNDDDDDDDDEEELPKRNKSTKKKKKKGGKSFDISNVF